jgi:hypothetical protein
MNLMGVPEESFICFVIITDFLRYHFDMVGVLSKKYRHLLSAIDYKNVVTVLKEYDGVKALTKPEKGFRNRDVRFFQEIKMIVIAERHSMMVIPSTNKDEANLGMKKEALEALDKQFIFHYHGLKIKKEGTTLNDTKRSGGKRKATGSWPPNPDALSPSNHEALSMPLDEDDYINLKAKIISK